jgi:hypothetical protein
MSKIVFLCFIVEASEQDCVIIPNYRPRGGGLLYC